MSDSTEDSNEPRIQIARFERLEEARACSLALAARELAFWIERDGRGWKITVEPASAEDASQELRLYAAEQRSSARPAEKYPPVARLPLFLAAWFLGVSFLVQQLYGEAWTERGAAENVAILQRGEWWRVVTALTLHADLGHLLANLATGLLFGAFLQPLLGAGVAWLLVLLSGVLGNLLNSWAYAGQSHASIGASTAVFGALGILVGFELMCRWRDPAARNRWSLIVPLGAGLALLAFLGVGEKDSRVDYMAHAWGLFAGVPIGLAGQVLHLRERTPVALQYLAGLSAMLIPVCCWFWSRG